MAGVARSTIDYSLTHIPLSGGMPHIQQTMTLYVGAGGKVFANGYEVITQDGMTSCGDTVAQYSTKVFANGKGVHRLLDLMESHSSTYTPSMCISASTDVFAN